MDRRRFLALGTQGLAMGALPAFLACFTREDARLPPDPGLRAAIDRARRVGKPLLVFLSAWNDQKRYEHARVFGFALNSDAPAALADLALCEVVCASTGDVAACIPTIAQEPDPWLALIECDGDAVSGRVLELPQMTFDPGQVEYTDDELRRIVEQIESASRAVFAAVHSALAGDAATLERRAINAARTLSLGQREAIEAYAATPSRCDVNLADRGAALLLQHATKSGCRDEALTVLSQAAAARLQLQPPPGAYWARRVNGCGREIEGHPRTDGLSIACGMGMIIPGTERFLLFLSDAR